MADDAVRTRLLQNMHDLRPDYDAASKERSSSARADSQLYALWEELTQYRAGDDPHKAVYLIARCQVMLEPFARQHGIVEAFQEARRKLEEYDMRRNLENG